MIIVLAGHNPEKPGACYGSFCEWDEATKWANLIAQMFNDGDCIVCPHGGLPFKKNFVNIRKPKLAVEIHFNSNPTHSGKGSETLYYPGSVKGKEAAETIQAELGRAFGPDRGVKEGWYKADKKNGPIFFLERTKCTSVIIEPEFIHNKNKIIEGREVGCQIIASAIKDFIND